MYKYKRFISQIKEQLKRHFTILGVQLYYFTCIEIWFTSYLFIS